MPTWNTQFLLFSLCFWSCTGPVKKQRLKDVDLSFTKESRKNSYIKCSKNFPFFSINFTCRKISLQKLELNCWRWDEKCLGEDLQNWRKYGLWVFALQLDPSNLDASNGKSWLLTSCPHISLLLISSCFFRCCSFLSWASDYVSVLQDCPAVADAFLPNDLAGWEWDIERLELRLPSPFLNSISGFTGL